MFAVLSVCFQSTVSISSAKLVNVVLNIRKKLHMDIHLDQFLRSRSHFLCSAPI